jgi:hypothetical protein
MLPGNKAPKNIPSGSKVPAFLKPQQPNGTFTRYMQTPYTPEKTALWLQQNRLTEPFERTYINRQVGPVAQKGNTKNMLFELR